MTGLDALQSVQYVTVEGKRFAVIDMDDWEALVEWLEDVEDSEIIREAITQLQTADHDPERAGWLDWDSVKNDL
jgi:hypothetical protein